MLDAHLDLDRVRCFLHAPESVRGTATLRLQCAILDLDYAKEKYAYIKAQAHAGDLEYQELLHSCELSLERCHEDLAQAKTLAYDDMVLRLRSNKRKAAHMDGSMAADEDFLLENVCVSWLDSEGILSSGRVVCLDHTPTGSQFKILRDDGKFIYKSRYEFELVEPEKKDIVVVLSGYYASCMGRVIGHDVNDEYAINDYIVKCEDDIRIIPKDAVGKLFVQV